MTGDEVLEFVESRGVVLESASGPVPSLAEEIAGEPVGGRWWGHPLADEIYAATRIARASDEILVCRLVEGKVTYVHRRLWPALVRLANRRCRTKGRIDECLSCAGRLPLRRGAARRRLAEPRSGRRVRGDRRAPGGLRGRRRRGRRGRRG